MQKIIITSILLIVFWIPVKSNQEGIFLNNFLIENEPTTEFEIIKSSIEKDEYEPTSRFFNFSFKAKRNGIWLPCEYNLDFYNEPKRNHWGFIFARSCHGTDLDKVQIDLSPAEYRKIGRIIAQKIKDKGFSKEAENALYMINNPKKGGCGVDIFH